MFVLAQNIWTSPKYFRNCKRTRHLTNVLKLPPLRSCYGWCINLILFCNAIWHKKLLLSLTVFLFLFSLQAFGGNAPAQNDDNVLTDEELALYNQLLLANNYLLEPNDKKRWKCEWRFMVTRVVKFPQKRYKIRSKFD